MVILIKSGPATQSLPRSTVEIDRQIYEQGQTKSMSSLDNPNCRPMAILKHNILNIFFSKLSLNNRSKISISTKLERILEFSASVLGGRWMRC